MFFVCGAETLRVSLPADEKHKKGIYSLRLSLLLLRCVIVLLLLNNHSRKPNLQYQGVTVSYYSEVEMAELRRLFELEVLHWPKVTVRAMFGCPSYQVDGRLFAFLVTGGVVITQLMQVDRDALRQQYQVSDFKAGERVLKYWIQVSLLEKRQLGYILPYVRRSYERALARTLGGD